MSLRVNLKCIGENSEKYKTFSVPIKNEMKGGNASVKNISCKIKFIDSMKLFANLLSHFVDNLTE